MEAACSLAWFHCGSNQGAAALLLPDSSSTVVRLRTNSKSLSFTIEAHAPRCKMKASHLQRHDPSNGWATLGRPSTRQATPGQPQHGMGDREATPERLGDAGATQHGAGDDEATPAKVA
eukprot:355908-Chlamydomonas_euryale.AAC.3